LSITGTRETPCKVGISVADIAAGMYAYSGVLTALLTRAHTGLGTALEVSLFDALAEWMGFPLYYSTYGGTDPERAGASHAAIAPYGPYAAGDGGIVYLAIQNEREWARFCASVLQAPELTADTRFATNAARVAHRDDLDAILAERLLRLSSQALTARLDGASIANARMNTVRELADHPQLVERRRWRTIGSPVGPIRALLPPVLMDDVDPVMSPIPAVGQHTDAVLRELGVEDTTIREWRRTGVV
jgi:crotonobetainyl-CoA:carnitine CoA-transferase CaiB-like acyl-CoA transferase